MVLRYVVCGVDDDGLTELYEDDRRNDAISWMERYVSSAGDAGGWDLIEVYDREFAEDPSRAVVSFWERQETEIADRERARG